MKDKMTKFAVIGMGRFGSALAVELSATPGCEVLAIDEDEGRINAVKSHVTYSATMDATDETAMKAIGIGNYDAALICVGGEMEASILISLICKEAGVKYIASKAKNAKHKAVLEKLGLSLVIIPEYEMGRKLAATLANPSVNDVVSLGHDYSLMEIETPHEWAGKTLMELNLRREFNVNLLVIKRHDGMVFYMTGDTMLNMGDVMVAGGLTADLTKLTQRVNKLKEKE